jgi:hypothetical protein
MKQSIINSFSLSRWQELKPSSWHMAEHFFASSLSLFHHDEDDYEHDDMRAE